MFMADNESLKQDKLKPKGIVDFKAIYDELYSKFPQVINLDKPVLLALGIKQELSKATGISITTLRRWLAQYFSKSKYYSLHKEGAIRYNLQGLESGIVTADQCEGIQKYLEKSKTPKTKQDNTDQTPN